jgi:aquaglyceroporin related protein
MRRVHTDEANQVRNSNSNGRQTHGSNDLTSNSHGTEHEGHERAPVNEHGLTYNYDSSAPGRNHFGMADGLHPLKEIDSHKTTQSEKDEQANNERKHKAEQDDYDQYRNPIARLRAQYPQAPAEFLATFVYLFLGICVNLSVATSGSETGSFETQAWGWGFAVMVGIYMAGGVSGAHLSPTISISLTVYRGFPWRMAIVYIVAQMLAGLCAGGLAYGYVLPSYLLTLLRFNSHANSISVGYTATPSSPLTRTSPSTSRAKPFFPKAPPSAPHPASSTTLSTWPSGCASPSRSATTRTVLRVKA